MEERPSPWFPVLDTSRKPSRSERGRAAQPTKKSPGETRENCGGQADFSPVVFDVTQTLGPSQRTPHNSVDLAKDARSECPSLGGIIGSISAAESQEEMARKTHRRIEINGAGFKERSSE